MKIKELKEAVLLGIEQFLKHEDEVGNKTTDQELNCFLGGLMSGLSFPVHVVHEVHNHANEINQYVAKSKLLKDRGLKLGLYDTIGVDIKL